MKPIVEIIKALSDNIRLRIINLLYHGELCVREIVNILSLPQSTVSRHLTVLKNAGVVKDRKDGLWTYYSLQIEKKGKSFIRTLIENELKEDPYFQKDIEVLIKRLEKGDIVLSEFPNREGLLCKRKTRE